MPAPDSQTFLRELDKKLWTPADRLRSCLDAAVYKHAVLGLIALAEEKTGGQWTGATKTSPQSRVYDSAMGFGGFFVSSERFIEEHGGKLANPPFNIKYWWDGKLEGDARWSRNEAETALHTKSSTNRGKYGAPPQGNANFAGVQNMVHHLAPNGSMALLLANGSMSSNSSGEGDIAAWVVNRNSRLDNSAFLN